MTKSTVKVVCQSSRSRDEKGPFSASDALYETTIHSESPEGSIKRAYTQFNGCLPSSLC